jgi:hypothetical protein
MAARLIRVPRMDLAAMVLVVQEEVHQRISR